MSAVLFRVSAASILIGVVATSLVPYATSYVSTSALVNAPIVTVRAPFDGIVTVGSRAIASAVVSGETLVNVDSSIDQQARILSLVTSRDALQSEILGMEAQLIAFHDLQTMVSARRQAEINARLAWYVPKLQEVEAQITLAQARLNRAVSFGARASQLSASGLINQDAAINAQTDLAVTTADLAQQQAVHARLVIERDRLAGPESVDLISTTLEQINGRLDDVSTRIVDLSARVLERRAHLGGLNSQITALTEEAIRRDIFAPVASASGIIWEASVNAGASVSTGDPLVTVLDCSRRFLEVTIPERHFEKIPTGTTARVKLSGASETFDATVVAAYGSGARTNSDFHAAHSRIETADGSSVIVALDAVDVSDNTVVQSFCDVGRTAEVQFDLPDNNVVSRLRATLAGIWAPQNHVAKDTPDFDRTEIEAL